MKKGNITKVLTLALLALLLVAVPLVGACAKPSPAPAPAPTPATKPSPAPAPAAKPHEPAEVVILGATAGGSAYIISAGIADLINKNSTWLKASVEETFGSNDNIMKGADDPKLRRTALRVVSSPAYYDALEGNKPFPRKYTDLKFAFYQCTGCGFMVSVNPAITSKEGLIGKKVVVGKELSAVRQFSEFIIRDCWGMWDKIKLQPMGWAEGKTALLDGLADAMQGICNIAMPGEFLSHPSFEELLATRDTYFFGPAKEEVSQGNKVAKRNYGHMYVPAGAHGPRQKMGFHSYLIPQHYYVYPEFPDDVLAEVLRIVYENTDKLGSYHVLGKGMLKVRLGWFDVAASTADIHPAAIKFFKERNAPLVVAGGPDPTAK